MTSQQLAIVLNMDTSTPSSRRQFLKLSGLAGATTILPSAQVGAALVEESKLSSGRAKNLIFLMVDGLCNGTLGLGHHWKLRNENTSLNWIKLFERQGVRRGFQDTASANSPVTDSAAAASAWGSGERVNNGRINTDSSGLDLKPLFSYAKEAGKTTGLVTTCRITHATPAGFSANVSHRDMEDAIARQYLEREIDVLLGGGARHFKQVQKDGSVTDYLSLFKAKGYEVATDASALAAVNGRSRILGLFSDSHIPYAIDRKNDPSHKNIPGLSEMFRAALSRLGGSKDGFVLQVEGGRVDHAGHANDPGAILHEFLEFDDCIPIALDYIEQNPDTMLIITTDHGTGGCQLDGAGEAYLDSGPALDRINYLKHSFEWIEEHYRKNGQFSAAPVKEALGIESTLAQASIVQAALDAEVEYLSGALNRAFGQQLNKQTAVGWSSTGHTSECVELFAFGPGCESLPAFFKNCDLFSIMTDALGLRV